MDTVLLRWCCKDTTEPRQICLPADQFYTDQGTPRHVHPWEYLELDAQNLSWLVLQEPGTDGVKCYRYQFLDGAAAYMMHSRFPNGDEEMVHVITVAPGHAMITRNYKVSGKQWTTLVCGIDSEQGETGNFTGGQDFSDLLAFQDVNWDC